MSLLSPFISIPGLEIHQNITQIQKVYGALLSPVIKMNVPQTDDVYHYSAWVTQHTDKMHSSDDYDRSLKVCTLCMQTTFFQKLGTSCYLNDSSNKLLFPFFWCAVFCHLSLIALFRSCFQKFPSELMKWKVVWGVASINILFAEIKAVFLWWKCILRCFANFHQFHSQHGRLPLSGLCWCGKFKCLDVIKEVWWKIHSCYRCRNT